MFKEKGQHEEGDCKQLKHQTLLSTKQASVLVCLSERTLQAFRRSGKGPQYVKVSSRCVRYQLSDLTAWINSKMNSSTSQGGVL